MHFPRGEVVAGLTQTTKNKEKMMTKVINSPCAASRARVDCLPYGSQSSSQSGYKYIPSSQTTPARARTCEAHAAIRNPEAYFRARRFAA